MNPSSPNFERFQAMLLEHAYGLLDEQEVQELNAFLSTPEGEALQSQAAKWQRQLAGAAKESHPTVVFKAPVADTTLKSTTQPATPVERRPSMANVWHRWVLSASVLCVLALTVPAFLQFIGWYNQHQEYKNLKIAYNEASERVETAEKTLRTKSQEINSKLDAAQKAESDLLKKYTESLEAAQKAIDQKDFLVRLSGPARIQPGAPNEWRIETLNKHGQYTLPKKLEVVMRDQQNQVVLSESFHKPQAPSIFKLPASFWEAVKPGTDLFLEVAAVTDDDRKSILAEKVPLARSVFVTQLTTDKPLYKPGETVRYRSLTLDRATFLPPTRDLNLKFRLLDPAGGSTELDTGNGRVIDGVKPVIGPDHQPVRGIGLGEYELPETASGGEYALQVFDTNPQTRVESLLETRRFIVNQYVPEVFQKKLEFDGKSYGAGQYVQAKVEASRTAGGPLTNARAYIDATLEGVSFYQDKDLRFDAKGVLNLRFKLPENVGTGNASLSVKIVDGGQPETIVRPIPVIGKKISVEFFPEGGDLIANVPNRVYFQVRTPQGKPADLVGRVMDGSNQIVDCRTLTDADQAGVNRGQGAFTFTPIAGKKYYLQIDTPSNIEPPQPEGFALPVAKSEGVTLTALQPVTERGESIGIRLQTPIGSKVLHVGAYARGKLLEHKRIELAAGKPIDLQLQGDEKLGGVTRITVFEESKQPAAGRANLIPLAERLVYRKPTEQLHLGVNPDKTRYSPAGNVQLNLSAVNEKEKATPAVIMVAVVNQNVITMADNKTDRLMPTHFLIAGDVKNPSDLEHADFLLTEHPKAAIALDLLLGTQGWRRFAEQHQAPAKREDAQEVDRLLVAQGQKSTAPEELYRIEEERVKTDFLPKLEEASLVASEAEMSRQQFLEKEHQELMKEVETSMYIRSATSQNLSLSRDRLSMFETSFENGRSISLVVLLAAIMLLVLAAVIYSTRLPSVDRRPFNITAVAGMGLAVCVLVGVFITAGDAPNGQPQVAFGTNKNAPMEARPAPMAAEAMINPKIADAGAKFDEQAGGFGGGRFPPPQAPLPAMAPGIPGPPRAAMDQRDKLANKNAIDRAIMPANGIEKEMAKKMAKAGERGGADWDKRQQAQARLKDARQLADGKARENMRKQERQPRGAAMPARLQAPIAGAPGFPGGGRGDIPLDAIQLAAPTFPFIIREYAHQRDPEARADLRSDFTETVYWHPVIVMPEDGMAKVNFQLSDSITTYQVLVAGHTLDGRIGATVKTIEARKPFTVDPKLPLEVTITDLIDVPVQVVNDSDTNRSISFTLNPNLLKVDGGSIKTVEGLIKDSIILNANEKGRKLFRLQPAKTGDATLIVNGNSEPMAEPDQIGRVMKVVPEGFPGVQATSDMLETRARVNLPLPKDYVKNTLKVKLEVYPTSMADLVKGLEGLLGEPNGCFEQTSTTNYPNTLILEYMQQANAVNPEITKRAKELLDRGYAKLVGYECPDTPLKLKQGFEWFGNPDMAHEALTAYGLLQFKDMAKVHQVDPKLIQRTQAFLMSRRDGKGGFKRNAQALDTFGAAPKHTTDAYITWALIESDLEDKEKLDLKTEIAALKAQALTKDSVEAKDSYFLALVASILFSRDDRETAVKLMQELQARQTKEGNVSGAAASITSSRGRDLDIEATAIAVLGWIRTKDVSLAAGTKKATKWITQQRGGGGGFGSTQSTIMSLKALIAEARANAHPAESGELALSIAGKRIGTKKYTDKDIETITLEIDNPETLFAPGSNHEVLVENTGKTPYPFTLSATYTALTPVSGDKCEIQLATKLSTNSAKEGDTVPMSVRVQNLKDIGQGMTVAIIGLPAGMKVPTDMKQLTDLREKKSISYFEIRGRELILYWRNMAPKQEVNLSIDLVCDHPGEYRGPASRAYLYYSADHKRWIEPMTIKISPNAAAIEKLATK